MEKRLLTLLLFLCLSASSYASHIVGGEFELLHIEGNTYRLNLILYFDVVNGNVGARDANVLAAIFRKSDDASMRTVNLPFISQNRVEYFQPACSSGEVVTDRLIYSTTIVLDSNTYNDAQGYYIAWERCCRNYTISNIFSEVPGGNAQFAGQTFYLEFPPVVDQEGEPFINSSPQLFPPLNDYGCPYRPYWVDFAGTDIDGDSLVYKLVTPLNTHYACAVATDPVCGNVPQVGAFPGPYSEVNWRSGYSLGNILGGSPDLKISDDGFLTVTPIQEGLFVFAVQCNEYRDGVKIGTVIRDFQLLVLDKCEVAEPPIVVGKKQSADTYTDSNFLSVTFQNTETDATRCVSVRVTDPDSSDPQNSQSEDISIKVIALNFDATDKELSNILPDVTDANLAMGSAAEFELCFPECPFVDPSENTFLQIGVIAFDDACTLPLSDTLIVSVRVIPPDNAEPQIIANNSNVDSYPPANQIYVQGDGSSISFPIQGRDNDGDQINMQINTVGEFDMAKAGMSFSELPSGEFEDGPFNTTFAWNLDCNDGDLDYSEGITISAPNEEIVKQFSLEVLIQDDNYCGFDQEDKLDMNLKIRFPGEFEPNVYQVGKSETIEYLSYNYFLNQLIELDIQAKDGDTDNVSLTAVGANFDLDEYGVDFQNKSFTPGTVTTPFRWSLDCDKMNLSELDSFRVYFITEDFDACNLANVDTLSIDFLIDTLQNNPPSIFFQGAGIVENKTTTTIRDELSVRVFSTDDLQDSIFLDLIAVNGSRDINDYTFENVRGKGTVSSTLAWTPDCQYLNILDPGEYRFTFLARDGRCPNPKESLLSLDVVVNDIENITEEFIPPNVFTPNGDGDNPYFGMYKIVNGEEVGILPSDNCEGVFLSVNIFNRWGREVYSSEDRNFKWDGKGQSAGVYFYQIKYSHITYKGSVSILF